MDIIGHRGARHLFMENTLDGLTRALDLGVDGLEMDLHGTKDGVLILHHVGDERARRIEKCRRVKHCAGNA